MNHYIIQKPNQKFLGLFRSQLLFYNLSNPLNNNGINRLLRKMGEAPVIFNIEDTRQSAINLASFMENEGYFNTRTSFSIDTIGTQKVAVTYDVQLGKRYFIDSTILFVKDKSIKREIFDNRNSKYLSDDRNIYLKPGLPLSPKSLIKERKKITRALRNRGYWDFTLNDVKFEVDTLPQSGAWVKTIIDRDSIPKYKIGHVTIYSNIDRARSDIKASSLDSTMISGVKVIYDKKGKNIRPSILYRRNFIRPGDEYSEELAEHTYSFYSDLPAIRSSNIVYKQDTALSTEPHILNCEITTQAQKTKQFTSELDLTNSSGNLGFLTSLGLKHNNIFGGAEQFEIKLRGNFESFKQQNKKFFGYGIESSIRLPRFLDLNLIKSAKILKSSTDINFAYDYQTRPEFDRIMLSAKWGYTWNRFYHPELQYTFYPININYLRFVNIDDNFRNSIPLYTEMFIYRDQFILGSNMLITYNSSRKVNNRSERDNTNIRIYLQTAGNLLYAISKLSKQKKDNYGAYDLYNINYSQFVKAEFDYAHTHRINEQNTVAFHTGLGIACPYGNSRNIPFDLRYFGGGANSVRGWGTRLLGPGSMSKGESTTIFDQVGDIKLDLNVELRSKLISKLHSALFIDAGNIWTIRDYKQQPGGVFRFDKFYKEIALSTGAGLRLDFDYFVLRFDMGIKIYDPQKQGKDKWRMINGNRSDLFAWHFGIGYPF
ncbi:BamA/TamA family outer membrane protein [Porphyromonas pogonae]|uniref:translocation and assembly module lipoprotein TamL n=1 Tax=Porphyromonas pogonae TaxID=867595 RepID=UPI002E76F398|nr:BamA/TamA family outer membrane protein [Porphyromonas pogonae]